MAGKNTLFRRIDAKLKQEDGETFDSEILDLIPLSIKAIEPPENLVLDSSIVRSALTAEASISAVWTPPNGVLVDQYLVQISVDNTFPADNTRTLYVPGDQLSIAILGLKVNTQYYVQVAAIAKAAISDFIDNV